MKTGFFQGTRRTGLSTVLAAAIATAMHGTALAQERWSVDEAQARADLPSPRGESAVLSAAMVCSEARWSFELVLEPGTEAADGAARMMVDSNAFETEGRAAAGLVRLPVATQMLDPLKRGLRLSFDFGEDNRTLGEPQFSLLGSRVAITAVEELCSRPDMSAYRQLNFTPYSSYMAVGRGLREEDIAQFRLATMSEPELTVAMAEFGGGRRVLFTRLCGSSWYFGRSGCNVTGFGPDRGETPWRIVFDSEGVEVHVDDSSDQFGWPDLVTLPLRGQGEPSTWRWQGSRYQLLVDRGGGLPE